MVGEVTVREMRAEIEPFDNYFVAAREVEQELLGGESPLMSGLRRYHDFFVDHVFSESNPLSPVQGLLAMDAFMVFLSSIRVAISGHGAAMFPLLRTALEASCYALLVGDSEEVRDIWLKRNSTPDALRTSKKTFRSPVADAAKRIQAKSWVGPNTEAGINQAYNEAIDFGAHPNPKGIWPYVRVNDSHPDGYDHVSVGGVYEADSFETGRCLMACLDYGLLIALILSNCRDEPCEDAVIALNKLNELKEELTKTCFPDHVPARGIQ